MDAQLSNSIVTTAIVVIAFAVVLQTISAVVSALATMKVKAAVDQAKKQIEPLAAQARELMGETRLVVLDTNQKLQPILAATARITSEMQEITRKANEVATRGQAQAEQIDEVLTETVDRVRVQLGNVESTMDHVLRNVRDTSNHINQGVLSPIRKVNGIVNGVSAALGFLLQGRTTVQRATHEDEMFI